MSLFVQQWTRGEPLKDWDRLNERLGELEFILREFHSRLTTGPVPGSYFPLQMEMGTAAVGAGKWKMQLPIEARPIMVSVGVVSGDVTVDINDDGVSIFASPVATSSGVAVRRARTDFATEKIGANSILTLDIDSISGTPRGSVLLVLKAVGKIEQV